MENANPYSSNHLNDIWTRMRLHPLSKTDKSLPCGVDGISTEVFERNLENNIKEISRKINHIDTEGKTSYRFGPLLKLEFGKALGGIRNIYIPRIKDQIVYRAIHEDLLSASEEVGLVLKTPNPALLVQSFREAIKNNNVQYVLRTDIRSFYDSIPRNKVVSEALKLKLNPITKQLLSVWSGKLMARKPWITGKTLDIEVEGLPQGISLSASLSELWLKKLDSSYQKNKHYFRYADDIAIVCESYAHAMIELNDLQKKIEELDLELSNPKTKILSIEEGVTWLGLIHFKNGYKIEEDRIYKWVKKFAYFRRNAIKQLKISSDSIEKDRIIKEFYKNIYNELNGKSSSRLKWYYGAVDEGQWKKFDSHLHQIIRSFHKIVGTPLDKKIKLPSLHRKVLFLKTISENKVPPPTAD